MRFIEPLIDAQSEKIEKGGNGLGSLLWDETDSCSRGCEFESQHQIRGGYFSHSFDVKTVLFV